VSFDITVHDAKEGAKGGKKRRKQCPQRIITVSVFYAPTNYGVVKIAYFSSMVVLQTTKHTIIYPSSSPSSDVIVLHPVV
jgi:hypothetical protein